MFFSFLGACNFSRTGLRAFVCMKDPFSFLTMNSPLTTFALIGKHTVYALNLVFCM